MLCIFLLFFKCKKCRTRQNEQFRHVRLVCNFIRRTDSQLRGMEKFIWRVCDYACRFDCGQRIEENVKQTTRRFFIRTFNSTLWIVARDPTILSGYRRHVSEQSFSSRYSRECFSSCDRRIIFATFSRNEKCSFQTTILENCFEEYCTAHTNAFSDIHLNLYLLRYVFTFRRSA